MAFTDTNARAKGCIASLALFILVPLFIYLFAGGYLQFSLFNSEKWKAAARSNDPARLRMVNMLVWTRRIDGLRRNEVVSLLGPPDDTPYFRDRDFVYWLGPERGLLSLDSEWLVVDFDPSDNVQKYEIVRD